MDFVDSERLPFELSKVDISSGNRLKDLLDSFGARLLFFDEEWVELGLGCLCGLLTRVHHRHWGCLLACLLGLSGCGRDVDGCRLLRFGKQSGEGCFLLGEGFDLSEISGFLLAVDCRL